MGYTFSKLAQDVLKQSSEPLSVQQIWEKAKELGLVDKLSSSGKTPTNTLSSILYTEAKDKNKQTFKKVSESPTKYILYNNTFSTLTNTPENNSIIMRV